jgi:hypothetical protein
MQNSPNHRGFSLQVVNLADQRFIIRLDPAFLHQLRGLGELLEQRETEKRQAWGQERQGPPRPGYGPPDPWYDGRGHNYTIVDSPGEGTMLTWGEVKEIFRMWADLAKAND